MATITLHSIFRHLSGDPNLLSTVIDNTKVPNKKSTKPANPPKKSFNIMSSMVTEYLPLAPYETQAYSSFPQVVKEYLTPDYVRLGIKNIIEKNMVNTNISFLNSLNILLRPDVYHSMDDAYLKNLSVLEEFIQHRITRNFQIDKTVKNTKKIQEANRQIVRNIFEGKITHDLIQYIVNIFEINLLVLDFVTHDITLYWASGSKYSYLNIFRNIYCTSFVQGNYEPIIPKNNTVSPEHIFRMYGRILTDKTIKVHKELKINICTLIALDSLGNIPHDQFIQIVEKYFKPKTII
jgi:hypothetical protein